MTDKEHLELLSIIKGLNQAKVLISGYDNELYNEQLAGWNKSYFDSMDGKGNLKQEVVWFNYELNSNQLTLF
jgi:DNA adenine methylase